MRIMEAEDQEAVTDEEKEIARKWYSWLWVSPLFTVPTFILIVLYVIYIGSDRYWNHLSYEFSWAVIIPVAVFGSALWHLILLIPAFDRRSFVRWHGRQAFLIGMIRTAILLFVGLAFRLETGFFVSIPFLIVIWFLSTLWSQLEATKGKSFLMHWLK